MSLSDELIGMIIFSAGTKAPSRDWLPCDGKDYDQKAYPKLFAVIGNTYGAVIPEKKTFRVPDMSGKVAVAAGSKEKPLDQTVGNSVGSLAAIGTVDMKPSGGESFWASPRELLEAPGRYNHAGGSHIHEAAIKPSTLQPSTILSCFIKAK